MPINVLNTDASLSGKTITVNENADTITGLKTFDRDPSAPFAVSSGSAAVENLDADKVDGIEGAALAQKAANETITGIWTLNNQFRLAGASQLINLVTGNNNDQVLNSDVIAVTINSAAGGSTLTGLTGGVAGRVLIIMNIGSGNTLTISNEDANSAAANRFVPNVTLTGGQCGTFLYTNRWRCIGVGN